MIKKKFKDYQKVLLKQIKDNRKEYNKTIDKCKKLNEEHEKLITLAKIEGLIDDSIVEIIKKGF